MELREKFLQPGHCSNHGILEVFIMMDSTL